MRKLLRDIYSVWWADLRILHRLWPRFVVTTLMTPVLYLFAFGFGLGRGMRVEGASYLQFVLPGIVALTAMNISFNGAGAKLNVDRLFYHCFDEMLMAPVSLLAIALGKSLVGVMRGMITALCFIILGLAASALRIGLLFILTLVLTCFLFSLLGVLAAFLAKSHQDMASFSSLILTPMTFLGGTFFSLTQVPDWLRVVLLLLPLTHATRCLRAEALGQPFPWLSLGVLAAFAVGLLLACLYVLRRASV